ncbi:hypothetical protein LUZ60_013520 [Juncus effusus]|nr:hypothetical protein LUZ60_013520 [Juncus effusus]
MTQFAMVEELASLIKDNLYAKHLILSTEDTLVTFLQDNTSVDRILELKPADSYHRLLLHRLADIYGFAHESVGEGEDRHLVLEFCSETAIPSVLISDILGEYDSSDIISASSQNILIREKEETDTSDSKPARSLSPLKPLEEREAAYQAARDRIFSTNAPHKAGPASSKPKHDPTVARRMIAHALGRRVVSTADPQIKNGRSDGENNRGNRRAVRSVESVKKEQMGAAKRMFANALGLTPVKGTNPKTLIPKP